MNKDTCVTLTIQQQHETADPSILLIVDKGRNVTNGILGMLFLNDLLFVYTVKQKRLHSKSKNQYD